MLTPILGSGLEPQRRKLEEYAKTDRPLVIVGEAGVGKSLFAAHLHAHSDLRQTPLASLNVLTSSERVQRLELFGADFENIDSTRRSILEQPQIALVKHINAAACGIQNALAGILRCGWFQRAGSRKRTAVNARTVFTLQDAPETLQKEGSLDTDLAGIIGGYDRISIPPLRERKEDLLVLAEYFLGSGLSAELTHSLLSRPWPDNVVGLKAYLRSIHAPVSLDPLHEICWQEVAHLILCIEEGREFSLKKSIALIEHKLIESAISRTNGNIINAARLLGVTADTIRWRREHRL